MESVGRKRKCLSRKNPQTVDTIESFPNQIREASELMKFDEFGIWNGAADKFVKQDWKKWQLLQIDLGKRY